MKCLFFSFVPNRKEEEEDVLLKADSFHVKIFFFTVVF